MTLHPLPHITVETGTEPVATVIWLHGLGADGHDFEPVVPQLGLPAGLALRFIFPHAPSIPVTLNGGYIMPAWYDIRQNDLGIEHDDKGIHASMAGIKLLIEQEIMRGIAADRIILAGFSQGAAMALHTGLRYPERLAGIIALSGYLLLPEKADEFSPTSRQTPIFMAHGINDPIVPFALGDSAVHKLQAAGYQPDWHSYPMQHAVCPQEISHIGQWITAQLSD
ncbi:MAG: dienelactone hydrolase family protein [Mariprofundus sp.]